MATQTSASLSFVLDEVVSAVAFESFFDESFLYTSLYGVRSSGRRRERLASIGGLGVFTQKNAGAAVDDDVVTQQFEKDYTHVAYGKKVPVERELIDDEEFGTIADLGQQLGYMGAYTMELQASEVFRDAFTGARHTTEDSLTLCNSAHLNVDSGNSQGNTGTSALSMSSIQSTRTAMRRFTNYRGQLRSVRPDALIIPPNLEETAWEIVRSTGRPDDATNAANIYNGMFQLYVWDFLDTGIAAGSATTAGDANNWFMVDSKLMRMNLLWYQRIPLEVFGDGDLFTGTRRIGAYYRASHGPRDWRWVYGHNVS